MPEKTPTSRAIPEGQRASCQVYLQQTHVQRHRVVSPSHAQEQPSGPQSQFSQHLHWH